MGRDGRPLGPCCIFPLRFFFTLMTCLLPSEQKSAAATNSARHSILKRPSQQDRSLLRQEFEFSHERQMIGRGYCFAAPVYAKTSQRQLFVVIDMIKMKNRKNTRVRAPVPKKRLWLSYFEGFFHESGGQTTRPFIEVANDNSGAWPLLMAQHLVAQEHSRLMSPLYEARA